MEDTETHKLPFSSELPWDPNLKLSNENFLKDLINGTELEIRSEEEQLDSYVASPKPEVLAHFAAQLYHSNEKKIHKKERLQFPGWKLLTYGDNVKLKGLSRGYLGAAFWHKEHRQIVIVHRGTKNWDGFLADFKGILLNKYVDQMNAACTFTYKIYKGVKECEKEKKTHFEIYFTGHSLGAWLAQITTLSLKYFVLRKEIDNNDGGYHAHTVVFDSPGCRDMLLKIIDTFHIRYLDKTCNLEHLDITTYLSSPNAINCCNKHVGRLYRIFPKNISAKYWKYTRTSHSIDEILQVFTTSVTTLIKVIDWPIINVHLGQWKIWKIPEKILGEEYKDFFHWAKDTNNYDPKPQDIKFKVYDSYDKAFITIRYQTIPVSENERSLGVFTQTQLNFLKKFQLLRIFPNAVFDEDKITKEVQIKIKKNLGQLIIEDESVRCDENADISQLISYVKTLLRLYPNLNERINQAFTDIEVRKQSYLYITKKYLLKFEKLTRVLLEADWPELLEFLKEENQVCQILAITGTDFAVAKALTTILGNAEEFTIFAFELQSLLTTETFFHLTDFLSSEELSPTWILLECKSGSFKSSENVRFIQDVVKKIRERANFKLILITEKQETLIDGLDSENLTHGGISWNELTHETQKEVLNKELIIFQGNENKISLKKLFRLTSMDSPQLTQLGEIFDAETLAKFVKDEDVIVGKNDIIHGDIYLPRSFIYNPHIKEEIFNDEYHHDLVAFSVNRKEDMVNLIVSKNQSKLIEGLKSRMFRLIESDEDFENLCQSNPNKNVHWLKYDSNSLVFHKTLGSLNLLRQQTNHDQVVKYSEDNLLENFDKRKTLIISDTSGMGKSTVLSSLARKIKDLCPNHWVIRVNLNACTEAMRTAIENEIKIENVLDATKFFVEQIGSFESNFERKLLEKALTTHGGVVLIFDGFDDISSVYGHIAADMLAFLRKTRVENILVTTRPHTKDLLEDRLGTLSHIMVPFAEKDQKEYLIEIWKKQPKLKMKIEELNKYAEDSISNFDQSIKEHEKSFLGIPVLCKLLAEYMIMNILKREHQEMTEVSLMNLYEVFLRRKLDIFEERYVNTGGNPSAEDRYKCMAFLILKMHRHYALKLILSETKWKDLDYPEFEDELKEPTENEVLRVGLMTNIGKSPQFQHKTFAEFIVLDYALSLDINKNNNLNKLTLLSREILLRKELEVIRTFLESLIIKETRAAETKRFLRSFVQFYSQNLLSNRPECLNEDGETVLHRLLEEQHEVTFNQVFNLLTEVCPTEILSLLSIGSINGTALHIAARNGNTDIVKTILQQNPNLKLKDADAQTPIHVAARHGHFDIISLLIESVTGNQSSPLALGQSIINAEDKNGKTALHIASSCGYTRLVSLLLENGADSDTVDINGSTPLNEASANGHGEIVRLLLNKGADLNPIAADTDGYTSLNESSSYGQPDIVNLLLEEVADIDYGGVLRTPLLEASSSGHVDIVRLLLDEGADINAGWNSGSIPLLVGTFSGHTNTVRYLIEKGADIHSRDNKKSTALIIASYMGHLETVKLLIEKGADINASDNEGSTALIKASSKGHLKTVTFLIDKGADIQARDNNGSTALIKALSYDHLKTVMLLISKGADVNASDNFGSTPLIVALSERPRRLFNLPRISDDSIFETVRLLVENGADVNSSDLKGLTPLHVASSAGFIRNAQFLISKGSNVNSEDYLHFTPLHAASKYGHTDLVHLLLQSGANVDPFRLDKTTPLHLSAQEGHLETVRVLLMYGANPKVKNIDDQTPLDLAIKYNHTQICELLSKHC